MTDLALLSAIQEYCQIITEKTGLYSFIVDKSMTYF